MGSRYCKGCQLEGTCKQPCASDLINETWELEAILDANGEEHPWLRTKKQINDKT